MTAPKISKKQPSKPVNLEIGTTKSSTFTVGGYIKYLIATLIFIGAVYFLFSISSILSVISTAFFGALILSPFLDKMNTYKIGDVIGLLIIGFIFSILGFIVLALLIPLFAKQGLYLFELTVRGIQSVTNTYIQYGLSGFNFLPKIVVDYLDPILKTLDVKETLNSFSGELLSAGKLIGPKLLTFASSGMTLFGGIFNFIFFLGSVFIVMLFGIIERKEVTGFILKNSSNSVSNYLKTFYPDFSKVIISWIKAQCILACSLFLVTLISLSIYSIFFNLSFMDILSLSLIAGLMEFIPYIGPFIALIPAGAIGLGLGFPAFITIVIVYLLLQQVEGSVLAPLVIKKTLDISPLYGLIVMLIFGSILGLVGVVLAIPIASILYIFYRDYHGYRESKREKGE